MQKNKYAADVIIKKLYLYVEMDNKIFSLFKYSMTYVEINNKIYLYSNTI